MKVEFEIAQVFEPLIGPRRFKGAKGGRASGKSYFFADQALAKMMHKPVRIIAIREVQNTIRDSVRALLEKEIRDLKLPGFIPPTENSLRHENGSYAVFRGMQEHVAEGVKSMEDFDVAWVEEAHTLSQRSWDILYPTMRKKGSEIWCSWNPRNADDPVDKFFAENANDPDVICVTANWRDNPWVTEETLKDRARDMKADPQRALHIWEGHYQTILSGAYYARDIAKAIDEGRVRKLHYDRAANVYAAFDLGIGDATAIWVFQVIAGEWRFLGYYEASGMPLYHYLDWMKALPFKVDICLLPHDADARELQTGKSRKLFFEERGFQTRIVKRQAVEDGIEAVRMMLPRAYWEVNDTAVGLNAIRAYRTDYSENLRTFAPRPLHDWSSHAADALRTAVMGINEHMLPVVRNKSDWKTPIKRANAGTYV